MLKFGASKSRVKGGTGPRGPPWIRYWEGEVCFKQSHIICTKNRQEKTYLEEQNCMKPNM